ncbi:MAG: metal-dependent hydrolase [Acidobacteria bacterium]|nr:metal-dependent hydrolase [Acidobacteriota bacterium]
MIPLSHVMAGVVVGRLTRKWIQPEGAGPPAWRDPLVAAGIAASCFPDWDVLPGLVFGYEGAQFHRGATHSAFGVAVQALAMTPIGLALWRWVRARLPQLRLAEPPAWQPLFATLLAGMGLHALVDSLNPWGVAPWWPLTREGARWNLVHEGDLGFLALTALAAAVSLRASAKVIALTSVLGVAAFCGWKAERRNEAQAIATRGFGVEATVFPSPGPQCPWVALAARGKTLEAACVAPAGDPAMRVVRAVEPARSPEVDASKANPSVADFLEDRNFAFAQLETDAAGRRVVLWRDLRESLFDREQDAPSGLAVTFDLDGRIAKVEHRWLLKLAF